MNNQRPVWKSRPTTSCASNNSGYSWIQGNSKSVPPGAVIGGKDVDGAELYVGRAKHGNELVPAKVIPSKNIAYIAHAGVEHSKHSYEVLCKSELTWISSRDGHVPPNAVAGGRTANGESLYIGRAQIQYTYQIGKVHPSHRCLYIPFGGKEHKYQQYEVLVGHNHNVAFQWENVRGGHLPANPVVGGADVDGSPIYVGRARHDMELLPAKVILSKRCAYVSFAMQEFMKHEFEVLCERTSSTFQWIPASDGHIPPNAIPGGHSDNGETLYIGREHHANSLVIGKVHPSHRCLYIPFGGKEIKCCTYQVLVSQRPTGWGF